MASDEQIGEILRDFCERRDRGEDVDRDEILRRHPDLAEELGARLDALAAIEGALEDALDLQAGRPETIGEYKILREIGRGGMGVVYEAEQASMQRRVALKVLSPAFTGGGQALQRFRREAQVAGRLQHTNIVPVYAMGEHKGCSYYAMELVGGRPLDRVISDTRAGEPVGFVRVAEMFAGVADALQLAHDEGVIHRDIKPSNLLLANDGALKIVDFGLARLEGEGGAMTMTGDVLGTPAYMSPEQALAKRAAIDHRTDIYSLGATLYELLTLRPPFRGRSMPELCTQIITADPVLPRRANRRVPTDLETIVCKAMEKDRAERYETAGDLARDLRRFADGAAIQARPVGPAGRAWRKVKRHKTRSALAAALLLAVAAAAFFGARAARDRAARDREAARRIEIEYLELCAQADGAFVQGPTAPVPARELYTEAIELDPTRWQAYLGRALVGKGRLDDADAAAERGAPVRAVHLARAWILRKDPQAAELEERLAAELPEDARSLVLEARLAAVRKDRKKALELYTRAIEDTALGQSDLYLALRQRAVLYTRHFHDLDAAFADLRALEAMGGVRGHLQIRTASILRRLGQKGQAEARMKELLADHAERGAPEGQWRNLCIACNDMREYAWLYEVAGLALKHHPDSAAFNFHRARAAAETGRDPEERLEYAERAIALNDGWAQGHLVHAKALFDLGRYEEAFEAAERANALNPHYPLAWEVRGLSLFRRGKLPQARKAFREAIDHHPNNAAHHEHLGEVLEAMGRVPAALKAYQRALDLNPDDFAALNNSANILRAQGEHAEALKRYDRALKAAQNHPAVNFNKAQALRDIGEYEEAVDHIDRAVANGYAPEAMAHFVKARILANRLKRFEEAAEALEKAASLEPKRVEPLEALLQVRTLQRKHELVLQIHERLLRIDGDNPERKNNLAWFLATVPDTKLRDHDRAVELAREAVEKRPDEWTFLNTFGVALCRTGAWAEGLEELKKSNKRIGGHAVNWFFIAMAHANLGAPQKARRAYELAMERMEAGNEELERFRGEAENLLGLAGEQKLVFLHEKIHEIHDAGGGKIRIAFVLSALVYEVAEPQLVAFAQKALEAGKEVHATAIHRGPRRKSPELVRKKGFPAPLIVRLSYERDPRAPR